MGELNPSNNYHEHERNSCNRCNAVLDVEDEMYIQFDGFERSLTDFGRMVGCKGKCKPSFRLCAKCAFAVCKFIEKDGEQE